MNMYETCLRVNLLVNLGSSRELRQTSCLATLSNEQRPKGGVFATAVHN